MNGLTPGLDRSPPPRWMGGQGGQSLKVFGRTRSFWGLSSPKIEMGGKALKWLSRLDYRNRQISRRIKKHLWLSNRSWARDVHSFGILHSWGALAGKSCSAQASSIWLIAGAFRRTQSK